MTGASAADPPLATLVVPGALRELAGGERRLSLPGATVGAMFDALAAGRPLLERRIRDERGRVRPHLRVYVGDTDIRHLDGFDTPIRPATEVYVVTAVSGG